MPTRDIPFDEECPDAPAHVLDNFADLRPLAEVEAMRRKWADRFRQRMDDYAMEKLGERKAVQ